MYQGFRETVWQAKEFGPRVALSNWLLQFTMTIIGAKSYKIRYWDDENEEDF